MVYLYVNSVNSYRYVMYGISSSLGLNVMFGVLVGGGLSDVFGLGEVGVVSENVMLLSVVCFIVSLVFVVLVVLMVGMLNWIGLVIVCDVVLWMISE